MVSTKVTPRWIIINDVALKGAATLNHCILAHSLRVLRRIHLRKLLWRPNHRHAPLRDDWRWAYHPKLMAGHKTSVARCHYYLVFCLSGSLRKTICLCWWNRWGLSGDSYLMPRNFFCSEIIASILSIDRFGYCWEISYTFSSWDFVDQLPVGPAVRISANMSTGLNQSNGPLRYIS